MNIVAMQMDNLSNVICGYGHEQPLVHEHRKGNVFYITIT